MKKSLFVAMLSITFFAGIAQGPVPGRKMSAKDSADAVAGVIKDQKGNVLFDPRTDSIPPMADSTKYISNKDLFEFWKTVRLVMTNAEFVKLDPIAQYNFITANAAKVFMYAEQLWMLEHKIKKPADTVRR